MPISLPAIGTVSYTSDAGAVTFGAATETLSVEGRPWYDPSDRLVAAVTWTVTIRSIIAATPPTTTDTAMETLRRILTRPGGDLVYSDKGFGPLSINTAAVKDINFGPKTRRLTFKPRAGRHAVEVVWTVETTIPECANAAYDGIAEATFRVGYEIDRAGLTKRTFTGRLRIANRWRGRNPADTADAYRERFTPVLPLQFQRVSQRWEVSEDKSQLDVSITDEELASPNAPPPGIVKIDHFAHDYRNAAARLFAMQVGSLSANYHVARGWGMWVAVEHFQKCIKDRVWSLAKIAKNPGAQKQFLNDQLLKEPPGQVLCCPLPVASSVREEPYEQKVYCSFEWTVCTSPTILFTQNMFRPMPDSDGRRWLASLADIEGPRGWAGLRLKATEDAVVSLCDDQTPTVLKHAGGPDAAGPPAKLKPPDAAPIPPPDGSWVSLKTKWSLEGEDHVLRHVPLESQTSRLRTPNFAGYDPLRDAAAVPRGTDKPTVQRSAATMPYLIFEGVCVRACYDIPVPRVLGAFGRQAVPANREGVEFVEWIDIPLLSPIVLRVMRWRQRYILVDADVNLPDGIDAKAPDKGPTIPPKSDLPARPEIAVMKSNVGK